MTEWFETVEGLWAKAWALFADDSVPRYIALATIGAEGPANRLVVLREAVEPEGRLVIYTDAASVKVSELADDPRAALAYWRSADALQVRLEGEITVRRGPELQGEWERLSEAQRGNYGVMPIPGSTIESSGAYTRAPDFDRFARLDFHAQRFDIVHLGRAHHRRVLYTRASGWQAQWLAP
jgi:hypothetical protein